MVYLIGVDHRIQHNSENPRWYLPEKLRDEFKKYLEEKGKQFKATLIAEELSEEALNKRNGISSNAKYVAGKLGIEHRFCDQNTSERKASGIEYSVLPKTGQRYLTLNQSEKEREIREKFWLDKIKDKANEPIIFICGYNHVESFKSLLTNEGYKAEVLSKNWGKKSLPN